MNYQNLIINNITLFIISFFTIGFFLLGYLLGENSAGAGNFDGDFTHVWNNLLLFKNNNFWTALEATAGIGENNYESSRTPLIYIINAYLNPLVEDKKNYIFSIFIFSIIVFYFFYYAIKKNYENEINKSCILLLSSIILLSPYFRTSSYWGLEENFGIFSLLISAIYYKNVFTKNLDNRKTNILSLIFFSSLCVYFDQKLIIIPLYCFLRLIFDNKIKDNEKIIIAFLYFILSIPFIYLIYIWKNLLPVADAEIRNTLQNIYLKNFGLSLTIIAFYIFPFLFLKKDKFILNFKKKINNYVIYILIFIIFLYIFVLIKIDPLEKELLGNGIIYKLSLVLFNNFEIAKIFLYISFIISFMIIYLYIDNKRDYFFIIFLSLSSIFLWPLLQEYFDPLMFILLLLFFDTKIYFSIKKILFLFSYFLAFFIIAYAHYQFNFFSFFN